MAAIGQSSSPADGSNNIALLRITLLGPSGSGKTSLINAFVNNIFVHEYNPTKDLTLYHTRLNLKDGDSTFNAMVEIEDTWASNTVSPDQMGLLFDPWWPLNQEEVAELNRTNSKPEQKAQKPGQQTACCSLCGHGFSDHVSGCNCSSFQPAIRNCLEPFSNSMPSQLWGVTCHVDHTLTRTPDAAGEGWLCDGKKDKDGCRSGFTNKNQTKGMSRHRCDLCDYNLCDKCHQAKLNALVELNPNPFDLNVDGRKYRPLTRNRMAYFIVFDANDSHSFKAAESLMKSLRDIITGPKKKHRTEPIVLLVGTKIDVDPDSDEFKMVRLSARMMSTQQSIKYKEVSALRFQGVRKLFREAVQSVKGRQGLWLLDHGVQNVDGAGLAEGCRLQ